MQPECHRPIAARSVAAHFAVWTYASAPSSLGDAGSPGMASLIRATHVFAPAIGSG